MKALVFDGHLRLAEVPRPRRRPGWARVRVSLAGICRTDLEIVAGYAGYHGILGHEFVGVVDAADDPRWTGRRVVGEINVPCGRCRYCRSGLERHCSRRRVLGIRGLAGCFAEYCLLPLSNLHPVPRDVTELEAVFVEPLAAACRILQQVTPDPESECLVLGDGKLGILSAWVLARHCRRVTLAGHHADKLRRARWAGVRTVATRDLAKRRYDLVVEATGSPHGLQQAARFCRPEGTIVLKTTCASTAPLDTAPLVVDEIRVVGSRCGPFPAALEFIRRHRPPLARLVDATYPLDRGVQAFRHAARRGSLKVLLSPERLPRTDS